MQYPPGMQASKPSSPRKHFNHKTVNIQAINNAPGWCGRGDLPTLKISYCAAISSALVMLEREGGREQDWCSASERGSGSRTGCPASSAAAVG